MTNNKRRKSKTSNNQSSSLISRRGVFEILGGTALAGGGFLYGKDRQTSTVSKSSTLQQGTGWTISHEDERLSQQYRIELDEVLAPDAVRITYDPDYQESQSLIIDSGGRQLDEYTSIVLEEPADPLENQATLNFEYEQKNLL